ncbi:MAG: hypothetical protein M3Z09_03510 [Acidobacteriota bacterium]|nr:hypothetical protein [Acidobacteriota bacterium]
MFRLIALTVFEVVCGCGLMPAADSPFLPLRDIKPGMHGTGKTIFSGETIADFDVEILGVLENIGPRQSLILGRFSGGPLEHTGVMQGMSGSPVYIGGKLIGAVALGFPYSKDPIAGIRPIEEMLASTGSPWTGVKQTESAGGMREIGTPVSFGGFTAHTLEAFAAQLRPFGLEPRQGLGVGGAVGDQLGDPRTLHPGSMISVQLMTGDLSVGADGTVTYIDGPNVYGFGHRFLGLGPTGLPFARSEVLALVPNLNSSFKVSAARELMGVIKQDRNAAITGELGIRADLVPVEIAINRNTYRMKMVNDRYLSPILLQMSAFSAIDGNERAAGPSAITVSGEISLAGRPPVPIRSIYSGEGAVSLQASLAAAIPLSYILQGGFPELRVTGVKLRIDAVDKHKQLQIEDAALSKREAHPGDLVSLTARMTSENGLELTREMQYRVPAGTANGTLYFSVADGPQTSLADLRTLTSANPRSADELIAAVNLVRPADKTYVRVWRADPDFQIAGVDLPDPPPSVAIVLAANTANTQVRNSKVAQFEWDLSGWVVSGAKTVQLEVKN